MNSTELLSFAAGTAFIATTVLLWRLDDQRRKKVLDLSRHGAPLVDIGYAADYDQSHAEGASNIPLEELETRIGEVASMGQPVLVCGNGFMRRARGARLLRALGYAATNVGFTRSSMTERPAR
jgi:rhodanese-related sulfurtransferase